MDFSKLTILEGKNWEIKLHHNQNCLGKIVLWFLGEEKNFADLNKEEQEEFFDVLKKSRDVLTKLFNPDMFNYACLGNATKHLHFHVIPRYSSSREFEGEEFVDKAFGSYPLEGENILSEDALVALAEKIKKAF